MKGEEGEIEGTQLVSNPDLLPDKKPARTTTKAGDDILVFSLPASRPAPFSSVYTQQGALLRSLQTTSPPNPSTNSYFS